MPEARSDRPGDTEKQDGSRKAPRSGSSFGGELVTPIHVSEEVQPFMPPELGQTDDQAPRVEVRREDGVVTGFDVVCPCGRRTRVVCKYADDVHSSRRQSGTAKTPSTSGFAK